MHGKRSLTPQHVQQWSQQQHRANIINSLSPSMVGGQDMRDPRSAMPLGASSMPTQSGLSDDVIHKRLLHRKQAELSEIIDQQRTLYSNLDNLDRQRSQILGDIDKTAAYQKVTNDINWLQSRTASPAARYPTIPPELRTLLPQNHLPPQFTPPQHMHAGHQMRQSTSNVGAARDAALHGFPPSTMQFLSNRTGARPMGKSEVPPSLMNPDPTGGFGNLPSGYPPKNSASAALETLRGQYEAKLHEMEAKTIPNEQSHLDKRRRFLNATSNAVTQKQQLMSAKRFHDNNRISSSFLPSEIMVQKNPSAGNNISVLSSSHQLLMSQREANLQREAQNMLFYQGMNNSRNPAVLGLNRNQRQRQHDGKLPETKRKLSKDFVPEVDTVVLGKGNIPKTNIGNLKLKGVVMDNIVEYANGERRKKIAVISRIINHVTAANYNTTGFVKYEDDIWWEMTERDARVKITALFRDSLASQYRSSSSSKVKRRQELRKSREMSSTSMTTDTNTTNGTLATEESTKKDTPPPSENEIENENVSNTGAEVKTKEDLKRTITEL